jgi:ribosomal protein S18 acetylase RimI-like enzyme
MNALSIRAAIADDLPTLSVFRHEKLVLLAQQDRRFTLEADAPKTWQHAASSWIGDQACIFLVVTAETSLVGYVIGWVQPAPPGISPHHWGMITDLALDAHGYHAGAARALVEAARAEFAKRDVTQMLVQVPHRGVVEQAFWAAYGATHWMEWLWIKS